VNIVLHTRASREFVRQVEAVFGPDAVVIVDQDDADGIARALATAEVLLHVLTPVTAQMIAAAPRLRLIQKLGVGVNTIALDAARAHGVAVCNMPGTNSQAVAEAALALLLAVLRRTPCFDRLTKAGQGWAADPELIDSLGEVSGRTVGLIGMGHSAQRLARALDALGAQVIYTARNPRHELPWAFATRQELLRRSDIVSLHLPLTEETRGMIDAAALAQMPRGAILINTARGELVDEAALADALHSGHLRGAGLDVFAREPVDPANPLLALPQIVASPHIAWLTPETLRRSLTVAAENARRVAAGEDLLHRVI
jgi:phosphoglycerate dehydrogenase-like enzyme